MDNKNDFTKSIKDTKNVAIKTSWFRDIPYHWATASLPLAYAVACVEVVAQSSVKAGELYKQIIESWGNPGLKAVYEALMAEVPDSELEKVKEALLHPETGFLPDPNKPFEDLGKILSGLEIDDCFSVDDKEDLSPEERKDAEQLEKIASLMLEFVITGFNRESDIKNGKYRVLPTEKVPWLLWAVMLRTSFESQNITIERLNRIYRTKKYKGKILDFAKIMSEQPTNRWHRRIIASGKAVKLKLHNDKIFINAARTWYQCRVVYTSVNKYCDAQSKLGVIFDPKNVEKQIRPCDDALGYIRRIPRKANK
jgi:hypothetical protein